MIAQLAEQEHEPRGGRLARRSQNSGRGNQNLSFLDKYLLTDPPRNYLLLLLISTILSKVH